MQPEGPKMKLQSGLSLFRAMLLCETSEDKECLEPKLRSTGLPLSTRDQKFTETCFESRKLGGVLRQQVLSGLGVPPCPGCERLLLLMHLPVLLLAVPLLSLADACLQLSMSLFISVAGSVCMVLNIQGLLCEQLGVLPPIRGAMFGY